MADPSRPVTGYPAPNPTSTTTPNGVYPPPNSNPSTNPNGVYPPPPPSTTTAEGVAYPYPAAAPPPTQSSYYQHQQHQQQGYPSYYQHPQPQHYPQQQQPYTQGNAFLRRVFSFLIILFVIFGTIVFIMWFVFRPRLPEFRVDNLSVNNFNLSGNSLSGTWDLGLTARNPNSKMTLSYVHTEVAVFYGWDSLVDNSLPPFKQGKKDETPLKASFTVANRYLENRVVDDIKRDREKDGNVQFNVRMLADMGFEAGIWRPRRRYLRVFCGDLSVSLSNNSVKGELIKGPKRCRVGF